MSLVLLSSRGGYSFDVHFSSATPAHIATDAAPPLGQGEGPDSGMLLAASVANCLAGSMSFMLNKYKNVAVQVGATAQAHASSTPEHGQRISAISVDLRLGAPASTYRLLDRALAQYEDLCVVTKSVRAAIPVHIRVYDCDGQLLAG